MAELTEPSTIELNGWLFKIQPAKTDGMQRLLMLIHGWTGDENVMSIFARGIPADYWLVYPRGPIEVPSGGYGWLDRQDPDLGYAAYREVAKKLWSRVHAWKQSNDRIDVPTHLMGFSQGAAICYTLAAEYPIETGRVAALAGYLPTGIQSKLDTINLAEKSFFIAHGERDDTVPIARAREAVQVLEASGAQVTYCEDSVGHKLSAACFRGLGDFFR